MGIFNQQMNSQQQDARAKARAMYKQDLDAQINVKKQMRGYGNMTGVEKEMNKDELHAYKKYDNSQYTLVPGISNQKNFAEPRPIKQMSPQQNSGKGNGISEDKMRMH